MIHIFACLSAVDDGIIDEVTNHLDTLDYNSARLSTEIPIGMPRVAVDINQKLYRDIQILYIIWEVISPRHITVHLCSVTDYDGGDWNKVVTGNQAVILRFDRK